MPGIYIHIPFCRQICHYCDFHRTASLTSKDEMLRAIARELESRRDYLPSGNIRTLYFGGGTPSVCSPDEIGTLIGTVKELWNVSRFEEVTLEANPDDLGLRYLEEIKAAGVTRLSIGIQSFNDDHLGRMNRRHTTADAVRAVTEARRAGFGNITIDLIYGLPWMTPEEWAENLRQALALGVQHISAYHLTIEPRTVFARRNLTPVSDETSRLHFDMLRSALTGAGYEHYEISNFALPGYRAVHNSLYWSGEHYLGVGPSAHSYDGTSRRWNPPDNKAYMEGTAGESEILTSADRFNEMVMTRLRTADGLLIRNIEDCFTAEQAEKLLKNAARYIDSGVMTITTEGRLSIAPESFLISDAVISDLFE